MEELFGVFISNKRKEKQMSLRGFARMLGISPVYLSCIERGERAAPTYNILKKIAQVFMLNEEERELMYDLAAKSKKSVSLASDLLIYVNENKTVHKALRLAKKCEADEKDWQTFIDSLSDKYL